MVNLFFKRTAGQKTPRPLFHSLEPDKKIQKNGGIPTKTSY